MIVCISGKLKAAVPRHTRDARDARDTSRRKEKTAYRITCNGKRRPRRSKGKKRGSIVARARGANPTSSRISIRRRQKRIASSRVEADPRKASLGRCSRSGLGVGEGGGDSRGCGSSILYFKFKKSSGRRSARPSDHRISI
jgi:hypothetical protein